MSLNHNILNTITNKVIEEKIAEAEDKIYSYVIGIRDDEFEDTIPPKIVKANSLEELYIKIFYQNSIMLLCQFVTRYYTDIIIKKYIDQNILNKNDFDPYSIIDRHYRSKTNREIWIKSI